MILLLTNPGAEFALVVIMLMWVFHLSLDGMVTSMYLVVFDFGVLVFLRGSLVSIGSLLHVIVITVEHR